MIYLFKAVGSRDVTSAEPLALPFQLFRAVVEGPSIKLVVSLSGYTALRRDLSTPLFLSFLLLSEFLNPTLWRHF